VPQANRHNEQPAAQHLNPSPASRLLILRAKDQPMRILVIDDDEIFCRMLVEIIESWGVTARWTTDGFAGYELMTQEQYDLCIIDVRMPLILGTDVVDAIKEDRPDTKIILASAFADSALYDYAKQQGIFLLSKPFTANGLLDVIERALGESIGRN
jgi:DNA-binding NtrC family response regulator